MLAPCVLLVILGGYVFRKIEYMKLIDDSITDKSYNNWWYSFDLFIPFVDLKIAHFWTPKEDGRAAKLRSHYRRLHIFLGWILIPIGLLALFGIIK